MTSPLRVDLVDISHYQEGPEGWTTALHAGVKGVYHKCTQGLSAHLNDANYAKRREEAKAAGMPFGAYHFAEPALGSAAAEAKHFLSVAKVKPGDLHPMLDLEENLHHLSVKELTTWVGTFVSTVFQATGVRPIVYTSFDLNDTHQCFLWQPRYNNTNMPPNTARPWKRWDIWQFSNGVYGSPNHIEGFGHVDLSHFRDGLTINSIRVPAHTEKVLNHLDPDAYYLGARNDCVVWLKQRLVAHGFGKAIGSVTSPYYGAGVKNAVRQFQLKQGWTGADADGFPGPETLKRLNKAVVKTKARKHVVSCWNVEYGHKPEAWAAMIMDRFEGQKIDVLSLEEVQDYFHLLQAAAKKAGHTLIGHPDGSSNALLVRKGLKVTSRWIIDGKSFGTWQAPNGDARKDASPVVAVVDGVVYVSVHAPVTAWTVNAKGWHFDGPAHRTAAYSNFHARMLQIFHTQKQPVVVLGDWNCAPTASGAHSPAALRTAAKAVFARPFKNTGHGEIDFAIVRGGKVSAVRTLGNPNPKGVNPDHFQVVFDLSLN